MPIYASKNEERCKKKKLDCTLYHDFSVLFLVCSTEFGLRRFAVENFLAVGNVEVDKLGDLMVG